MKIGVKGTIIGEFSAIVEVLYFFGSKMARICMGRLSNI